MARAGQQPVRRALPRRLAGKDHRPRRQRRPAPQLAVDEVGDAPEEQPDRRRRRHRVADPEDRQSVAEREADDAGDDAEKAAVEGHAALPDGKDFSGMRGEVRRLVEEDVAEPPAEDDAEDHPGEEVVRLERRERAPATPERRTPGEEDDVAPAEEEPGDVGERVPADGELDPEEVEGDERRVDVGKGNDVGHRGVGGSGGRRPPCFGRAPPRSQPAPPRPDPAPGPCSKPAAGRGGRAFSSSISPVEPVSI